MYLAEVDDIVRQRAREWLRPLCSAGEQLILVVHHDERGTHPLWTRIESVFDGFAALEIEPTLLAGEASVEPLQLRTRELPLRRLPAPRRWWSLPKEFTVEKREVESYSSLSKLCDYPHEWVLQYAARLRAGRAAEVMDGTRLFGNLGHRLFEEFFRTRDDWRTMTDEAVLGWVRSELPRVIEREGAVLLGHGRGADRQRIAATLERALVQLLAHFRSAGVVEVTAEASGEAPFAGRRLVGSIDLMLTCYDGRRVVLDVKWAGESYRRDLLAENRALQLATYSFLLKSQDRGRPLASEDEERRWSETSNPIVSRIVHLRGQTITQSPVEIVARVLNYVGIRPIVTAWGPDAITAAQRQRNLDAFLHLSVEYENHCASQHEAATLTGFLFWLENPTSPDLDLQPVMTGGDAVHVLTYHRAKGLEWPVVVATDLHYKWWPRIWEVRVESASGKLDLDNPLEGRTIRFYPNVFGRNLRGVPVLDNIMSSEEAIRAAAEANAEGRRLAYVGMTRARDTIIIAVPESGPRTGAWIEDFDSDHLLPTGDRHSLPEGEPIPSATVDLAIAEIPSPASTAFSPAWFLERSPTEVRLRERVSPSDSAPVKGADAGEIYEIGPRIAVHSDDMGKIGSALHAAIAAELVNPHRDDAVDRAAALIRNGAGEGALDPRDAVDCARRLLDAVNDRFTPLRLLVEHPVTLVRDNGQVLRGWIDLLLETEQGWIVIDHKSSPRPRSEWTGEACEYSGQLAAYASAIRGAGLECAGCWVHFPVSGGLVEVVFSGDAG